MIQMHNRVDAEKELLFAFNGPRRATVQLVNSLQALVSRDDMKHMVAHRFKGRIRYYNNDVGICTELLYQAPDWTFNVYDLEGERSEQTETRVKSKVNDLFDFTLDELDGFIQAFRRAHRDHGIRYRIYSEPRPFAPEAPSASVAV